MSALLEVNGLTKRFGGFVALDRVDLAVYRGERVGLIGPNGSGKSTLVDCICGTFGHDQGSVRFAQQNLHQVPTHQRTRLGLARTFQLPRPFPSLSVAENVRIPIAYAAAASSGKRYDSAEIDARCRELLHSVGLDGRGRHRPGNLTQIDLRKLELARAMATAPRLLILDEVMAGLSHTEVDDILALVLHLSKQGVTIIMIEHIMRAVMAFSQRLAVLSAGRKIADGDPAAVVRQSDVVRAYLGE